MSAAARPGGVIGPIIGHRGAAGHAPENTLASLRTAAALGLGWVEFDVRLSRDGRPVLFHDDRLERTTDGRGLIADHDAAALARLDAGSWFDRRFAGEPVPTLAQALATLGECRLGANVEIKADAGREGETGAIVAATLAETWPGTLPPPLVSSFSEAALRAVQTTAPHLRRALLVRTIPADCSQRLAALDSRDLHCGAARLRRETVGHIRAAGVAVRCYTVNDPAMARRLFGWGVEALFSDYPDRLAPPRLRLAGTGEAP